MAEGELFLSTEMVEPGQRNDFWREITKPVFETWFLREDGAVPLEGSIRSRPIGSLLIGSTSFNQQRYSRNRRTIMQGGLDNYLVQVLVSGTLEGDFNGRSVVAGPGDICILDLAQPLESRVEAGSRITVAAPRGELEKAAGWRNLHGMVLKAGSPMTRLIIDYLKGLICVAAQLPSIQLSAVQDATVTLLAAGLTAEKIDTLNIPSDIPSSLNVALRHRILEFIDLNIASAITPDLLIRRFQISRSHLYRAFASDGGVAKVIRDKRLDAAYRELVRPGYPVRSVTEIAYQLGFSDSNHFLRAFRARFHMTPTEARAEGLSAPPASPHLYDLQSRWANYADQLKSEPEV